MPKMTEKEMMAFFNDVVNVVHEKAGAPVSIWSAMEKYGIAKQMPAALEENMGPMLKAKVHDLRMKMIPHNCGWCGACGLCDGWIVAQGSQSAHLLRILD